MVKATGLPVPFMPEWKRVQFITPTFTALCQEGVRKNAIVANCLSEHVFAYPEARLKVYRKTAAGLEPLPNHPLQILLDNPNPQMGQAELLQYIALYKPIGGSAYLYKVRSAARRVVELLPLNDSQITPVGGNNLPIDHYNWTNEETGKDEAISSEDIVHLKWMPDPLAPHLGLSPLIAVAREIDLDAEARRYLFALLKNDAVPRTVITGPPGMTPLSKDERERLENLVNDRYSGDNRGKAAVLGGLDIKRVSLDLQELAFEALSRVPEARIAGALRVPPVLAFLNVGLEQMTYNNVEGMRRIFTEGTMSRLWRIDADEIGTDLLPEFGNSTGLIVKFDTSEVPALQENVAELRTWANDALSRGGITRNQYLAYLGLPPDPNGNVYLMSMSIQEVPAGIVSPSGKVLLPAHIQTKAKADRRKAMLAIIAAQRQNRETVAKRMEGELDNYFGGLADKIVHRALSAPTPKRKGRKALLDWDQLLFDSDSAELETLVKSFYSELIQLSWDNWNLELGVDVAFDMTDPAVTQTLKGAGARVKAITKTTRTALEDALKFGNEQGWSIDHLVRGDAELGRPGLRDMIEQTYKGRAQTIARTELGNAQQMAATSRYDAAGVDRVFVLDGGAEDSDDACNALNDKIVSLEWSKAHPIGHPRCVRAFGAAFPDDGPIDEAALANWEAAGGDSDAIGGK
jgi:HK97 family phage portal protein